MKVVLRRALFNMNFHKTIFGGSIFSACDPYFPTMYYHIFANKNRKALKTYQQIWKENFKGKDLSDDEIVRAMVEYPKLIERPIVVEKRKAIIGRPPENVLTLFD